MSRSSHRKEVKELLAGARKMGLLVEPWVGGAGGSFWRVSNPDTGESTRVLGAASRRSLLNERAKIRRLIALPGDSAPAAPTPTTTTPKDDSGTPSAPAHQSTTEMGDSLLPTEPVGDGQRPTPVGPDAVRSGDAPEDPPPTPTKKTKEQVVPAPDTVPEPSAIAHAVWDIIRSEPGLASQDLDGVPGLLWVGSVTDTMVTLWPSLQDNEHTRRDVTQFLTATENMVCLRRGSNPKWWLRAEWNPRWVVLRGATSVRKPARAAQPAPPPPPTPVTTTYRCPEPGCGYRASSKQALGAHSRAHTPKVGADTTDPVAAITALVERNRELELTVTRLGEENRALREDNQRIREQLGAVRAAIGGAR
jgi:hypothetical protein